MKFGNNISLQRFMAQLLFLALPTICVGAFLLWRANSYFSILNNQWIAQLGYYSGGLIVGLTFYIKRFRFSTTFGILVLLLLGGYKLLDNLAFGEFDAFFISKQFLVFSILFSFGWICGWGIQRIRFFSITLAALFFFLGIYLLSKTGEFDLKTVLFILLPITFYGVYLVFAANEIYRSKESNSLSWRQLALRLILFLLLLAIVSTCVVYFMFDEIKEKIENYGGGESNEGNSMLQKNKDGSVSNENQLTIKDNNNRNNELIFCAHIDNVFPGTDIPNPLYLTSFYFTKFDTLTETFERDPAMPFNDEFLPDPSQIPLFSIYANKNKIDSALSIKNRKEIEIEIYKKKLSKDAFLAPSTAFEVQPITVEKDYQKEFKYAYRAKSYVSDLNSAYFIYNTDDPMIKAFQEQRFSKLRKAKNEWTEEYRFLNYYTFFPSSKKYAPFQLLADSLSMNKTATIDKILAIRDHFQSKDPLGEAVYSYSDNPGIPGLPGASKITNFMFETKKGWCTYYAGATLLLLRAMKIPSRIAVGFLTVDRSDNNKGWYWFYQDQAHAWVQVYFPEYGWLDFDFTIGNEEAQQSPTPDGTPPLQPPKPVIVLAGEIQKIDTFSKEVEVLTEHILYNKKEFIKLNQPLRIDLQATKMWKDSLEINIRQLEVGDDIMTVNYDPTLSYLPFSTLELLLAKLPHPTPMDELYIKTVKLKEKENIKPLVEVKSHGWQYYLIRLGILLAIFICGLLLIPFLIFTYFKLRFFGANETSKKAYFLFKASSFYLHQLGYSRQQDSLLQFAKTKITPVFQNDYEHFVKVYLKLKYSKQELTDKERTFIDNYWSHFIIETKKKINFKTRFKKFLNLNQFIHYFYLPNLEDTYGRKA